MSSKKVIAAVSDYWILGTLELNDRRVQEVLNDSSSDFLKLDDVEIHVRETTGCVAKLDQTVIPKAKLQYVVADSCEHETPERRWNNLTAKAAYRAFAIVGDDCLSGNLHFSTKPTDTLHTWLNRLSPFFVLTEAELCIEGRGINPMKLPLVFANKDHVSCFEVGAHVDGGEASAKLYPQLQATLQDEEHGLSGLLHDVSSALACCESIS